jgi:hypothetical protein
MMQKTIQYLQLLVPALFCFGPSAMVGYAPTDHSWAYVGASMTSIGGIILFAKIMLQSKQIEELSKKLQEKS